MHFPAAFSGKGEDVWSLDERSSTSTRRTLVGISKRLLHNILIFPAILADADLLAGLADVCQIIHHHAAAAARRSSAPVAGLARPAHCVLHQLGYHRILWQHISMLSATVLLA